MANSMELFGAIMQGQIPSRVPVVCNLFEQGAQELGLSIKEYYSKAEYVVEGQMKLRHKYDNDVVWGAQFAGRNAEILGSQFSIYAQDGPPNVGDLIIKSYEDIEKLEARPPNDLDLVTFFGGLSLPVQRGLAGKFPEFSNKDLSKANFSLDHYPVDITYNPSLTVELTRYWIQLFTHNRKQIWKGIVRIDINTPGDDGAALDYLNTLNP